MTSIFDLFETDAELELQGVWVRYGTAGSFRIARAGGVNNTRFARTLDVNMQPHDRQLKNKTLEQEVAREVLIQTFVDSALKGWEDVRRKGTKDVEGNEIPGELIEYNRENALKLFADLPDLFDDLSEQARQMATYRNKEQEEAAGNS